MRKKTEMKRKAILKVAHEVFCERGYEKTSMNEIAARLGGSKTTLYGYFSSKKLLFQEVMSAAANRKDVYKRQDLAESGQDAGIRKTSYRRTAMADQYDLRRVSYQQERTRPDAVRAD